MIKSLFFSLLFFLLLCTGCKKGDTVNNPLLEKYFETNILTRHFIVSLAKDNTTDLTPNYNDYMFVLLKTDLYHGPIIATKNGVVYNGTWSSNSDYSKLIITLPETPAVFNFLSRSWRFTSKNLPTMKLAPWSSRDPVVLHMLRK